MKTQLEILLDLFRNQEKIKSLGLVKENVINYFRDLGCAFKEIPCYLSSKEEWESFTRIRFEIVSQTCQKELGILGTASVSMTDEELEAGLTRYLMGLYSENSLVQGFRERLYSYSPETVGGALRRYYSGNDLPVPGLGSAFPAKYLLYHDLHHVLTCSPTNHKGELQVLCFEQGMLSQSPAPRLLLEQLEIFLGRDVVDSATFCRYWNLGARAKFLYSNSEESESDLEFFSLPLEEARGLVNIQL